MSSNQNTQTNPNTQTTQKTQEHKHNFELLAYARFLPSLMRNIRPIAYSNEIAESFRHYQPRLIKPLYSIAFGYIGLDIIVGSLHHTHQSHTSQIYKLGDSLLWHGTASVVLPGLAIHQGVKVTNKIVNNPKYNFSPKTIARTPVIVGLAMIPLIVHPIDHFVDYVMDNFIRPRYPVNVKEDLAHPQDFSEGLDKIFGVAH